MRGPEEMEQTYYQACSPKATAVIVILKVKV